MTTALVRRFAQALACTTDYLIGMYEDEESERKPAGVALVGAEVHAGSTVMLRDSITGIVVQSGA